MSRVPRVPGAAFGCRRVRPGGATVTRRQRRRSEPVWSRSRRGREAGGWNHAESLKIVIPPIPAGALDHASVQEQCLACLAGSWDRGLSHMAAICLRALEHFEVVLGSSIPTTPMSSYPPEVLWFPRIEDRLGCSCPHAYPCELVMSTRPPLPWLEGLAAHLKHSGAFLDL